MRLFANLPKPYVMSPEAKIPAQATIWLNLCLVLAIGWHLPNIPIWAILSAFIICFWRFLHDWKHLPLPPKQIKLIVAIAAALAIWLKFGTLWGRDPGITALALFSALKLWELKSNRDFMLNVYLCFFLLLGNFLYDQAITYFLLMIILTFFLVSAILRVHFLPQNRNLKKMLYFRAAAKILLFSLPLTVFLFLFFPRTPGFFWNLKPFTKQYGTSGFRERIYLGEVARITQSEETAFRVVFPDRNIPPYKDLYFRGIVLWNTDGRVWFLGSFRSRPAQTDIETDNPIKQEIILEPQNHPWLFALDTPHSFPSWSRQIPGQVCRTPVSYRSHIRYQVQSTINYQPSTTISSYARRWALQLPRNLSPKLQALVKQWQRISPTDKDIVDKALDHFRKNNFVYTLTPGLLNPKNPIEDFLINKKRGFCEHYASSFALLMRMAGVPSRVVLGYQGGKFNRIGNYLTMRQMDAHAWTEVWIDGRGWQRVDPTAVVAPDRITYGIEVSTSLAQDENLEGDRSKALKNAQRKNILGQIIDTIKDIWETIEIKWSFWIISYNRFQQWDFLKFLGSLKRSFVILLILTVMIASILFSLIKYILGRETKSHNPLPEFYEQYCNEIAQAGVIRFPWEGPLDFMNRALDKCKHRRKEIEEITNLYIKLRYGRESNNPIELNLLKKNIQQFKV